VGIAEAIRQHTLDIRDALASLDKEIAAAVAERDAAEQRAKRCGTEITRQRAVEGERKKALNVVSERVAEAQSALEDLERKRQEAQESLFGLQEEQRSFVGSLREAQDATGDALAAIRREQKASDDTAGRLERLRSAQGEKKRALRQALGQALDSHLRDQADRLEAAFHSQEQRAEAMRAFEEFRRARNADPEVSRLCAQREELQKFLGSAMVPAVREVLEASLKAVEQQLVARFPKALMTPPPAVESRIEDLLFYENQDGKAVFLLPVAQETWSAAAEGEGTDGTWQAMCFVWSFLRELGLGPDDGRFVTRRGRPAFESHHDLEEVAVLGGVSVRHCGSVVNQFALAAVPAEVQEALTHEGQDD
jgi:DNA repair exonuclease SbcCD ATPase subunit